MKIFFTFKNCVDPDEMQHYAAFHLGLHCLQKYSFRGFPSAKVLIQYKSSVFANQSARHEQSLVIELISTKMYYSKTDTL